MKDVQGKVAFITGGASGMGLGMARAFSAAGMKVMIGDIEEEPMNRAVAQLNAAGGNAAGVKVDVTQLESVSEAGVAVTERFGKVHIICNNAGVGVGGKCETASMHNWKWVMDVNMWGVVHGLQVFVPLITSHGEGGHVVNTASMAGMYGLQGAGPYNASKFAVVGISETMMAEHAKDNLGISLLCPGIVATNISSSGRNRAEAYGGPVQPNEKDKSAEMLAKGLDPDIVGKLVLEAIQDDQPYIFTDPSLRYLVERRTQYILKGYDWADNCESLKGANQPGLMP